MYNEAVICRKELLTEMSLPWVKNSSLDFWQ